MPFLSATYVSNSCTGGCSYADGVVSWDLGNIVPGTSGELSFAVQVTGTVPLGTNIQNIALAYHTALAAPDKAIANTRVNVVKLEKEPAPILLAPGKA